MRTAVAACLLLCAARPVAADDPPAPPTATPPAADVRESVVKLFATQRVPDLARPWHKQDAKEVSGSGVVIEGNRILTNAHVVLYASQVYVQAYQSSDKIPATVEAMAPGMDLAVVKVSDESIFNGRPPMKMAAGLPDVKDTVSAYGYPVGGTSLSITKGIVSRIEFSGYQQGETGLRVQVDAALNPGNSGGPALVEDAMIGLVFGHLTEGENIGYIIPNEEIVTFLADVGDGTYQGKLRTWDRFQSLENEALRGKLKLDRGTTGLLVNKPYSDAPEYPLKRWDVVTKIGEYVIDNVGMIKVKDNLRLQFGYVVPQLAANDKVRMSIVRDGQPQDVEVPVLREKNLLLKHLKGQYPSYFVYGPLVFTAGTATYVQALGRFRDVLTVRNSPLMTRLDDEVRFDGEELAIVAGPMFPNKLSRGYGVPLGQTVAAVNGVEIKNLRHLVETLRDLKDPFVEFRFADEQAEMLVFNREEVLAANDEILSDNGIRLPYSPDLRDAWEKK